MRLNFLRTFLLTTATLRVAILYALLSVILSRIPLFDYLGYEFSAVLGIAAGLAAGLLTISLFSIQRSFNRRWSADHPAPSKRDFLSFAGQAVIVNELLLLIPLLLISLNALLVKNCSFTSGLAFFFLIPGITVFFAVALGLWTSVWLRRPLTWYVIFFVLILLHPLYVTLTSPQLFAYNFFFGYFPGFTYDEVLKITTPFLLSRLFTIVAAMTLVSFTLVVLGHSTVRDSFTAKLRALRHLPQWKTENLIALGSLTVLIVAYGFRNELGFESTSSFVQRQLGSQYTTPHFRIYYSSDQISDDQIRWIAAEHEFRYMQVTQILRVKLNGKIDSYIYPTPETKRKLIGTRTTNIAKPHRREIHLSYESFESAFRHELIHVIAGEFGMPILRISPSPGLIEGLAVAIDWAAGDRTPHQFAAALLRSGKVKDIRDLFSFTGFHTKPSSVSYLLSGSFCRYLLEEYGVENLKAVYRFAQFEKVYQQTLLELIEEWKEFLHSVEIPPTDDHRAALLFARPSIFAKVCARTIAEINEEASQLLRAKKYPEALGAFHASYAISKNRDARLGMISAQFQLGNYDSVVTLIRDALEDTVLSAGFIGSKLTLGDCYWLLGQREEAEKLYNEVRSLDLHPAYNEAAAVRVESLRESGIEEFMKRYLAATGDDITRKAILQQLLTEKPGVSVARYLLAKAHFHQREYKAALENSMMIKRAFTDRILNFELEKMRGLCLLRLKDFQAAKIHLWQSLNYTPNEGDMNFIKDLIDFCDWLDEHRHHIQ